MANDVFLSYRRKDTDFIQRLDAAFRAEGIDPWVDWEDIPKGAEWWAEIQRGIEGAHTFVFSISPDSIASDSVCLWEIKHAKLHNKYIVPVIYRDIENKEEAPHPLPLLDWLSLRESENFEAGFKLILEKTLNNLEWRQAHTRLTIRAVEWKLNEYNNSFLLTGEDLKEARRRLQQRDQEPELSDLQVSYITASQQLAIRRQRTITGAAGVALAIAALLCCVASLFFQEAQREAQAQQLANDKATVQAEARATSEADQATAQAEAQQAINRANTAQTAAAQAATAQSEANRAGATAQAIQHEAELNRDAAQIAEQTAQAFRAIAEAQRVQAEQGQVEAVAAQQTAQAAGQQALQAQQTAQANQATAETLKATALAGEATAQANQAAALAQQAAAEAEALEAEQAQAEAEAAASLAEQERQAAEQAQAEAEAAQTHAGATAVAVQTVQAQVNEQIADANILIDEAKKVINITQSIQTCGVISSSAGIDVTYANDHAWVIYEGGRYGGSPYQLRKINSSGADCQGDNPITLPGGGPRGIAAGDGALWIVGYGINLKIEDLASPAINETIPINGYSEAVLADDGEVWAITNDFSTSVQLQKIDPINDSVTSIGNPIQFTRERYFSFDLAYDGKFIWITDRDEFAVINPTTTEIISQTIKLPAGVLSKKTKAISVIFAADHIWMAADDKLFKFQPPNTIPVATYTIPGKSLFQLAYDGSSLWLSTYQIGQFIKVNPENGAILATVATIYPADYLLAFDPDNHNLWAVPWANTNAGGFYEPAFILKIPIVP